MFPIDKSELQRALVNVTKSERAAVTFPADWAALPWAQLDFLGWRDPKIPHRGYLVRQDGDDLLAVAVQTTDSRMSGGRKAMCSICRAVDTADCIALFAARRAGPAGRRGDTVGTYICAGLDCSAQLRLPKIKVGRTMLADGADAPDPDELALGMLERLDAFVATVRAAT